MTQWTAGVIWWQEWQRRAVIASGLLASLMLAALLWQTPSMVGWGLLSFFVWVMPVSVPLVMTGHIQYWLLYILSPLRVTGALLFGLYPLLPDLALLLSWGLAFPFALGVGTAETSVLWVYRRSEDEDRQQQRYHVSGPTTLLAELRWNTYVRHLRLLLAGVSLLGTLLFILMRPAAAPLVIPVLAWITGLLRLEAILLGWLRHPVLVSDSLQLTYYGRFSLFASTSQIMHLIYRPAPDAALALLILLREAQLAPVLRRRLRHLPAKEGILLLLHLSLHPGGTAVLDYLRPTLSPALRRTADDYAALATTAAHPMSRQAWRGALVRPLDIETVSARPMETTTRTLRAVREALDSDSLDAFDATGALDAMRQLIQILSDESVIRDVKLPIAAWPFALLAHLEGHRQRLRTL